MNKTYQELCDENIQLREQLEDAQASINLARLTTRQALAKAEQLERDALRVCHYQPVWAGYGDLALQIDREADELLKSENADERARGINRKSAAASLAVKTNRLLQNDEGQCE